MDVWPSTYVWNGFYIGGNEQIYTKCLKFSKSYYVNPVRFLQFSSMLLLSLFMVWRKDRNYKHEKID